jgi:hypothetical protein
MKKIFVVFWVFPFLQSCGCFNPIGPSNPNPTPTMTSTPVPDVPRKEGRSWCQTITMNSGKYMFARSVSCPGLQAGRAIACFMQIDLRRPFHVPGQLMTDGVLTTFSAHSNTNAAVFSWDNMAWAPGPEYTMTFWVYELRP